MTASATAAAVMIGNELLSGKIRDSNAWALAQTLRELGVRLVSISVIEDDAAEIARVVRELAGKVDHVFTSGGVGPTHDDVTMPAIAAAFDRPLERHQGFADAIASYYGSRTNELVLSMADIPRGAELLGSEGVFVPVIKVENVYVFPGVPSLFEAKLASVAERFRVEPYHLHKVFLDLEEGDLAEALDQLVERYPDATIGSYPRYDDEADYRLMVTIESKDAVHAAACRDALFNRLPDGALLRSE